MNKIPVLHRVGESAIMVNLAAAGRRRDAQAFILDAWRIRVDPLQVRRRGKGPDDPATRELAESIRAHGLLSPLDVRWIEAEDVYEIVTGERRFVALTTILGAGEIPVRLLDVKPADVLWLQLHENLHREDLHPLDLARAIAIAIDGGMSIADVAGKLYKSATFVQKALTVAKDLTPAAAEVLRASPAKGLDAAYEIAGLPEGLQEEVSRGVIDMNQKQVRAAVRGRKKKKARGRRPRLSLTKVIRAPSGAIVTIVTAGGSTAELIAALKEALAAIEAEISAAA